IDVSWDLSKLLIPAAESTALAVYNAQNAYYAFRQTLITVLQSVHNSYVAYQASANQLTSTTAAYYSSTAEFAKVYYPGNRALSGAKNIDVLNAQQKWVSSQIDQVQALTNFNQTQVQL